MENYTFASIFVGEVFLDPNQKRRIKKIVIVTVVVMVAVLGVSLVVWLLYRQRQKREDEMERRYSNMIEYIQDDNFVRAEEECSEALKLAEKLKKKKEIQEISDYQKLIEAVNVADDAFSSGKYGDAQSAYVTAKERSRYADRVADDYIDKQLSHITDYLSVFDYIQLGDTLAAQGDFERAEEKYLHAKKPCNENLF